MFKVICMKIGIIGCGAIAREIASRRDNIVAVYDICPDKCSEFNAKKCTSIEELIQNSEFIIEAASPHAVQQYASKVIDNGKPMLIMSVGGLVDAEFRNFLFKKAEKKGVRIYLPAGAIGGLDIIRSAKIAGINKAKIITTKNPRTLGVNTAKRAMVFRGTAKEAIERFPKSTNVTVMLMIATGVSVEVEVYADPKVNENIHEIYLEGEFGAATITVRNRPSIINPRTSYLAALSPIEVLNTIESPVWMGV